MVAASAVCVSLGCSALYLILLDGPEAGDPVILLYALPVLSVGLALGAVWQRERLVLAASIVAASFLGLALQTGLVVLFAG